MRLVGINTRGVQSLGRHSVGNTGYEGDVALSRAMADTLSGLTITAAGMIDQRQKQKADLNQSEKESDFWEQYGGRDFFDVSELPGDVVTDSMRASGSVSSAEVMPKLYEQHMKAVMEESSSMIGMPGSRKKWMGDQAQTYNKKLVSVQMEANSLFEKQTEAEQKEDFKKAMDRGRPELALGIANEMWVPDEEKNKYRNVARIESEILAYEDLESFNYFQDMEDANPEEIDQFLEDRKTSDAAIQDAIDHLSQTQTDYANSDGNFDSTLKIAWRDTLVGIQNARKTLTKSKDKKNKQDLQYRVASLRESATKELGINSDEVTKLYNDIRTYNKYNDNELHKLELDLKDDIRSYQAAKAHLLRTPEERRSNMQHGYNIFPESGGTPSRNARGNEIVRAMEERYNKELITNPMKAAASSGLLDAAYGANSYVDIDFRRSPAEVADQLKNRLAQYELIQAQEGAIGGGILESSQEAPKLSAMMNSLNPRDQQQIISTIQAGLGDDSGILYGQLALDGSSKTFSIAGNATNGGNQPGSENMLAGMAYYKENHEEYKEIKESIATNIDSILQDAYNTQPKKKAAVKEAILHGYVGYTQSDGGNKTSFDSDILKQAARDATGGLFEYGGDVFANPVYDRNENENMGHWLHNLNSSHIENVGSPAGLSASEFTTELKNNNFRLTATRTGGEFTVQTTGGVQLMDRVSGKAYRIKYDPTAAMDPEPKYLVDYIKRWIGVYE